jgi:TatD DNase family protein
MQFVDTHCHIHEADYALNAELVVQQAAAAGVSQLICVGTSLASSEQAIEFSAKHPRRVRASVGLHPHDTTDAEKTLASLKRLAAQPAVVAVGECGLDYYYLHSPKQAQRRAFSFQIELARQLDLPLIFHVREAFDDFFAILDEQRTAQKPIRGVVHSFSAGPQELKKVLERGLYVGLNGIMTFTKQADQLAAARLVPLDRLVLETDAPYLTPVPYRGKVNESKYVVNTAQFLAKLRGERLEQLAEATTTNATRLFQL